MSRKKISLAPFTLQDTNLEDYSESLFEDSQPKQRRAELRRWRKLKHQLA